MKVLTNLKRNVIVMSLLGVTILAACKKDKSSDAAATQPSGTTNIKDQGNKTKALTYQVVWSDEFNGSSLDLSKWAYETGPANQNNEQQYYTNTNAAVTGGNLVITARRQDYGGRLYTSSRINSAGKYSPQYGKIEARIKMPMGNGLWPAFWMLGNNIGTAGWPSCGEIDIMEHVNVEGRTLGTMHWMGPNGYVYYGNPVNTTPDQFHTYSVEWTDQGITWFIDGVQYHQGNIANGINSTQEFHQQFFMILNLAVGGDWPGQNIDLSKLPASMSVDYVRVSKLVETGGSIPYGQTVTLKSTNARYVSGENGTQAMTCSRTAAQGWEQFTVVDAGGGKVALRSQNKYVSSENGVAAITCSRTTIGDWEKFDWINNSDGSISLRGNNARFISSENGTQAMTCNRTTAPNGSWETFRVNQ